MSDIQGADDTATGGPVNDMPNMPNAAPNPSFVPQGLGGLARVLRMMQGGPAPQAAQPAGSSWMTPPGAKPQQQSIHPDAPRWQGTTASLAMPKGSDQPPAKFSPFIPTRPRGDWQNWGKPEEFGMQPSSFELGPMYQGLGKFFGGQSGLSGPLGLLVLTHAGDYMKGVMMGEEFRSRQALENLHLRAAQLAEQQQKWHTDTADIMRKYFEVGGEDKAKAGTVLINGVNMNDAVHAKALENGDKDVSDMIENGASADAVMRYVDYRDSRLKDLQKANAKAQEQAGEDKMWDDQSGGSQPSGEPPGSPFAPSQSPGAPAAEAPAPGSDQGAPAPTAIAGDPFAKANPDAPSPDAQPVMSDGTPMGPEDAATLQAARGYELDPKMAPAHRQQALIGAERVKGAVQDIIDSGATGEDLRNRVRAIPKFGRAIDSELQGVNNYKIAIGGQTGISTGGRQGEWSGPDGLLSRLAQAYNPKWNQAYYHDRDRFRTDATTQMTLLRTSGLSEDANSVLEDLRVLEKSGRATTGLDLKQVIEMAARDPSYAALAGDWQAYNHAFNTVITGGRHTESGAQAAQNVAPTSYASPAAFRAVMKGHMQDAYSMIEGLHRRWQSIGGEKGDMPAADADLEKNIRNIRDMDWLTGTFPGQTWTNPKTGKTKTWQPKDQNSRNPYDGENWK